MFASLISSCGQFREGRLLYTISERVGEAKFDRQTWSEDIKKKKN